jgi:hypothetical protein
MSLGGGVMKSISLRILFATVLSLMCILFGAGYMGCNGVTDVAAHIEERTDEAVLERDFKIKYGQELTVKGEDLKVKFASVLDSRCPGDVTCHWAGDAKILISVRLAKAEESQIELHTNQRPVEGKYQEYVIRLVALYPRQRTDVEVKPTDYVATLLIKKE